MEQEKELGCGIRVIFVLAKSFIRSPASIPTPGSRWTSSVPGERNCGVGPTGASYVPMSEGRIGTRSGWGNGTRLMPGRYYPGTEEGHTNPTRQRGECLSALAGASG